jgi:hypothetical protein
MYFRRASRRNGIVYLGSRALAISRPDGNLDLEFDRRPATVKISRS